MSKVDSSERYLSTRTGTACAQIFSLTATYLLLGGCVGLIRTLEYVYIQDYIQLNHWREIFLCAREITTLYSLSGMAFILIVAVLMLPMARLLPKAQHDNGVDWLAQLLKNRRSCLLLGAGGALLFGTLAALGVGGSKRMTFVVVVWLLITAGAHLRIRRKASDLPFAGGMTFFFSGIFLIAAGYIVNLRLPIQRDFATIVQVNAGVLICGVLHYFLIYYYLQCFHVRESKYVTRWPRVMAPVAVMGLLIPVFFFAGLPVVSDWADKPVNPKNILLISIDTLRASSTTLVGPSTGRDITPRIRGLAEQGTVFQHAISQSSWTMPAFASILTGKYPHQHGAITYHSSLSTKQLTLQEILRESGYYTACAVSGTYVNGDHGFSQGFDYFNDENDLGKSAITSESVTDLAIEILKGRPERPFFLFLHYFDPHYVYNDHQAWDYADTYRGWAKGFTKGTDIQTLHEKRHLLNNSDIEYLVDLYEEEIGYTDEQVGRLLSYVISSGLDENTAIVLVSDHGEEFMEHGRIGHTISLHEELINVPLVCVFPGVGTAGTVITDVVETRGIFAMILEYLGLPHADSGSSDILSLMRSQSEEFRESDPKKAAFSTVWLEDEKMSSIRTAEWKMIIDHTRNRLSLYDLVSDPLEEFNLADQVTANSRSLHERLTSWLDSMLEQAVTPSQPGLTDEMVEDLKSLGYL